jgi:hypothetical protein
MRTVWKLALMAAVVATPALAQPKETTCLEVASIRDAKGEADGASILFRMRGGNFQYRNKVSGTCTGLAGSAISWTSNAEGKICAGPETKVWVQASASACALGRFERILTLRGNGDVD